MKSRFITSVAILVLGIFTPLAPRLALAASDPEQADRFSRWIEHGFSIQELPEWAYVTSPFLLLAAMAFHALRDSEDPGARASRTRSIWITTALVFGVGIFLCYPVRGQGMNFYIGEDLLPIVAFPFIGVAYPLINRVCQRRTREKRTP